METIADRPQKPGFAGLEQELSARGIAADVIQGMAPQDFRAPFRQLRQHHGAQDAAELPPSVVNDPRYARLRAAEEYVLANAHPDKAAVHIAAARAHMQIHDRVVEVGEGSAPLFTSSGDYSKAFGDLHPTMQPDMIQAVEYEHATR